MTPRPNTTMRRPAGPTPPKANYKRELRDTEYKEVLDNSRRMGADFQVLETIKL
jgi:hypothetical protein